MGRRDSRDPKEWLVASLAGAGQAQPVDGGLEGSVLICTGWRRRRVEGK